jgi:hypothetical protein
LLQISCCAQLNSSILGYAEYPPRNQYKLSSTKSVLGAVCAGLLAQPGLLIADTDEDLSLHAFLGHSVDMQGFRAGEFVGVDPSPPSRDFVSLRAREIGVKELADLWNVNGIREHLQDVTTGRQSASVETTYNALMKHGGRIGKSLAEALQSFRRRKQNRIVRALLQNSDVLRECGYSFRSWLVSECAQLGLVEFPPRDFRREIRFDGRSVSLERALRLRLAQTFYLVGVTMAPYIICDWQLWLWNDGKTALFDSFKLDDFHEQFVNKYGRDTVPLKEPAFISWWYQQEGCEWLPPRLANECIWLGMESAKNNTMHCDQC